MAGPGPVHIYTYIHSNIQMHTPYSSTCVHTLAHTQSNRHPMAGPGLCTHPSTYTDAYTILIHVCAHTRQLTHKGKRSNVTKEGGFIQNLPCSCGCGQKPCLEALELKATSQRPLGGDCALYTCVKGSSQRSCPQRRCSIPLTRNGGSDS